MMPLDCTKLTPDEREALFGREFREIHILSFGSTASGALLTCVVIAGKPVHLIGDPEKSLSTYLGGRSLGRTH